MIDLSHWDIVDEFSGAQVVILINGHDPSVVLGVNPVGTPLTQPLYLPAFSRMRTSYDKTRHYFRQSMNQTDFFVGLAPGDMLQSVGMQREMANSEVSDGSHSPLYAWLNDHSRSGFDSQLFSVAETARWLDAIGSSSVYRFKGMSAAAPPAPITPVVIDPTDLPSELDYANQAHRAVFLGHGSDTSATFRNRIVDYLANTYKHLTPEAIQRIATVANPDKSTGRKKPAVK